MTTINWQQRATETTLEVRNFINGEACSGFTDKDSTNKVIQKNSPRNGQCLYQFEDSRASDVDLAVTSAKAAFQDWRKVSVYERKTILHKLADLIEANAETFALYESLDVGKPIAHALYGDIPTTVSSLRKAADNADKLLSPCGKDGGVFSYQQRKPVGVVGAIVGWNFPLNLAAGKLGPALAMGNCLVLKPSEFTSLSAWKLAELATEAGIPPGVFNVVNGAGHTVGDALARHPDIDLLSFVGSSATGKQMMVSAGQSNMKRLILECGGKSPYLIFDDCPSDLDMLAEDIVGLAFPNQGALCVAGSRVLIQRNIKEKLLEKIVARTKAIVPQDPLDPNTHFGALVNEAHMNKVLHYIDQGKQQGAELICGGHQVNQASGGYYIEPTIFDKVDPRHTIAQEEIFGPVLAIFTFDTEEEAIALANDSGYGLAAYAATENSARAQRLGDALRAGQLSIAASNTMSGLGVELGAEAHRQSGFGVEGGLEGLKAYTVSTAVNLCT